MPVTGYTDKILAVVDDIIWIFICYNPLSLLLEAWSLLLCCLSHAYAVEHFCSSAVSQIYLH